MTELRNLKYYLGNATSALEAVEKEIEQNNSSYAKRIAELEVKLEDAQKTGLQIKSLNTYKVDFADYLYSLDGIKEHFGGNITMAKKVIEEQFNKAKEIHAKNISIIAENRATYNKIVSNLTSIGIPKDEQYKKRTRWAYRTCPWVTDLCEKIPMVDISFNDNTTSYNRATSLIKAWEDSDAKDAKAAAEANSRLLQEFAQKEQDQKEVRAELEAKLAQQDKEKEKIKKLVYYSLKLNLGADATCKDVVQKLLSMDKYLNLVHYLKLEISKNTNDFEFAKKGIEGFKLTTPEDSDIYSEITSLIKHGEDGEVDSSEFTDCNWSPGKLQNLIKPEIFKIYESFIVLFADELNV